MVERMKRAIKPFYTDVCTVYEKLPVNDCGRTVFEEKVKYERIPCRISFKSYLFGDKIGNTKDELLAVSKKTKIFLPPEYYISPGSRIAVESGGRETVFAKSGEMRCYFSHNEVMAEILKDYA